MKRYILIGLVLLAGCQTSQAIQSLSSPDYEAIAADAAKASHLFMSKLSRNEQAGNIIPPQFWGEAITQLKPVRVEFDKVNVVIVMFETDDYEEGYYCCPMISSYWPADKKNITFKELTNDEGNVMADLSYYRKHKNMIVF